jgi:4-amino-4-deoxy-L-arabinose transferase-like glycosyltransferase
MLSTAYYFFFPYAVIASRSFQPDVLMVSLIISFWWMFARWLRNPTWTNALLAGLLGGLAIFIKFSAAFFVIGTALALVFSRISFRELLRNAQIWAMAIVGAVPALAYLIYGIFVDGHLGGQFAGRFIPALLLNPFNYLQWAVKADMAAGGVFIALGLLGFVLTEKGLLRSLMTGIWISYAAYSLFFNYHVATHDYYHLPLIAIVAVSLSPLGSMLFARLAESTVRGLQRSAVYLILSFGLFISVWNVRNQMKDVDYRPQAVMFTELGQTLSKQKIVALTQDYGARLEYWSFISTFTWPYISDETYVNARGGEISFDAFDDLFAEQSSKKDFFLITDFEEFNRQPRLREGLRVYPMYMQGDGFVIYDLRDP